MNSMVDDFIAKFQLGSNVRRALQLIIVEQCTIPFVARYRQSEIGQAHAEDLIKWLKDYQTYEELQKRIHNAIATLEKRSDTSLTSALRHQFRSCKNIQELEDLWLPFKKKTSTRAQKAIEAGLGTIAQSLYSGQCTDESLYQQEQNILRSNPKVHNREAFKTGVNDILAQLFSQDAQVRVWLRRYVWNTGVMHSKAKASSSSSSSTSSSTSSSSSSSSSSPASTTYDGFSSPLRALRPHQTLALERGAKEKKLTVTIKLRPLQTTKTQSNKTPTERLHYYIAQRMRDAAGVSFQNNNATRRVDRLLTDSATDAWTRLLRPSLNKAARNKLLDVAKEHAVTCFGANVKSLLLQPPLPTGGGNGYSRNVLGVDPGFYAGCKLAAIDHLGNVLETTTIYPHSPQRSTRDAQNILLRMICKHNIGTLSIGNGTASRETETLVSRLVGQYNQQSTDGTDGTAGIKKVRYIIVNEAGASVYSTSANATAEFGRDTNPLFIGAVSIARRLQDPLSELVKIPPRSMGVGMYQHDLNEKKLDQHLTSVVQAVVSDIGVLVNQASVDVLRYVSGLNKTTAANIHNRVRSRGPLRSREELKSVKGIGARIFEQCAGFLRIPQSTETLDDTNVHPESYALARATLSLAGATLASSTCADKLQQLTSAQRDAVAKRHSVPTLRVAELISFMSQPGALSDPRRHIPPAAMREGPMKLSDIKVGTLLNGTVRNLTSFGAFVDIGVGTDGLLHATQMDRTVTMGAGMTLKVVVLEVDLQRKRIALGREGGHVVPHVTIVGKKRARDGGSSVKSARRGGSKVRRGGSIARRGGSNTHRGGSNTHRGKQANRGKYANRGSNRKRSSRGRTS
jgi:uncharacterized protein